MGKPRRGEATVDLILATVLRVYAESGLQGSTVNAVTKAGRSASADSTITSAASTALPPRCTSSA
ncbi:MULTISPECIES: hypothetical protein [unclassified Streptomyces]|uniref:hypothetical protein n=1 Tax=unclassified Streptomyces TaxID=2593676 RepID=UPI003821980E